MEAQMFVSAEPVACAQGERLPDSRGSAARDEASAPPDPPAAGPKRGARAQLAPWQVKAAKEIMLAQLADGLALGSVAARLSMTVNHFIKAFRHTEGIAPYQWFTRNRILRALALLRDETMPLANVAAACGFADQSHFTKAFTRVLGVSPGRWRRRLRNGASAPADGEAFPVELPRE